MNRAKWVRFQRSVERRWQGWDRRGGGQFAEATMRPFEVLRRPTYNPLDGSDLKDQTLRIHLEQLPEANQPTTDSVHVINRKCFIEPDDGFVILDSGELFTESVGWAGRHRARDLIQYYSRVPDESRFDELRATPSECRYIPRCVSLRFVFDQNYGHAMFQLLPSLLLLDDLGIDDQVPILVAPRLATQPFFQDLVRRGRFAERTWLVADDRWVVSDEVIVPRVDWPTPEMFDRFLDQLAVFPPDHPLDRRLFVQRATRTFTNQDEINKVLTARHYEVVRPETMTFAEQIDLFSNASTVAGATGAGLTNIMFRRVAPSCLLEIARNDWRDPFFHRLSAICRNDHHLMIGPRLQNDSVAIDLDELASFLDRGP
ncbi:MAG: glycosyltransferase family 61 protein [Acidimicrobiales bacterium]